MNNDKKGAVLKLPRVLEPPEIIILHKSLEFFSSLLLIIFVHGEMPEKVVNVN